MIEMLQNIFDQVCKWKRVGGKGTMRQCVIGLISIVANVTNVHVTNGRHYILVTLLHEYINVKNFNKLSDQVHANENGWGRERCSNV